MRIPFSSSVRPLSHLDFAHAIWKLVIKPKDLAIDATAGNGHDSLFLATEGLQLAIFDIQEEALAATRERLKAFPKEQLQFYKLCHSKMGEHFLPNSVKLIVFNLGYLPGGDKSRTTTTATTLMAIEASCHLLAPGGLISITCYPGHPEGQIEESALLSYCKILDPTQWHISSHNFPNRPKHPHLIILQKLV